jgi:DNA modification methylase
MKTSHRIFFQNAKNMDAVDSDSIDLVVTSPPYPMIEMWDAVFSENNPEIVSALDSKKGNTAFELMHNELDAVWDEVVRVLKKGGFACINIGDAARTINGDFMLYPNHSRILASLYQKGLSPLPAIIWRKQTNAPNKFMGSGVLPAGAYVTLEHEYILILRKGGKRTFGNADLRAGRQDSALFWEERNQWFSDVWMDLKGARQDLVDKSVRKRSGAFPFELPYRLINMYSVKGDTVLDPFLGLGTTMSAAMTASRNSVGFEIDRNFDGIIEKQIDSIVGFSNLYMQDRLKKHEAFVKDRIQAKGPLKYTNCHYGFPVIMNQEKNLMFNPLLSAGKTSEGCFEIEYSEEMQSVDLQQEGDGRVADPDKDRERDTGQKTFQQLELKI